MDDDARIHPSISLEDWLDRLAQPTGAPGGGAASGIMMATAASLLHMVAAYTPDDERAVAAGGRLRRLRDDAVDAAQADGVRSAELGAALAHEEDDDRDRLVREAAIAAAGTSQRLGDVGMRLVDELHLIAGVGNPNLSADLVVAAEALAAGLGGALTNLRACVDLAEAHAGAGDEMPSRLADAAASDPLIAAARVAAAEVAAEHAD
ncbi:cyclodeaminase/cyclohydrolase family protein [Microbacterium limosum]|uniref:Cyclodeaminase/cyclohydrolase family protein n=1 Tax=Microbacterium limosum TaxID=3079935 RepID=A0AAU0MG02_9MICO|nr:cyclodeaminase/cyclohydrolase family protein [Microbacterium sp. Y20]WOQ69224.1 cyclodeaminase/cyclohydrolase family protein [Microbacterium sp. Y20]